MRDIQYPGRSVVMSRNGMVATSHPLATETGLSILRQGGNAMDAAIAAGAVQCVVEPGSTGIGGDCFLLYHEARTGRLHGLNGSGRAPARATLQAYRNMGFGQIPESGIPAVTVPGAIDAWQTALERFGTRPFAELLAPAIYFAGDGYPVTPVVARAWRRAESALAKYPESARALLVDGRAPAVGTVHRQPALAQSLRLIARGGKDAFYCGAIADEIVRYSRAAGGLFEAEDFASHRSDWVEPIGTNYRGYDVRELPPNGQGIAALMTLNILEQSSLPRLQHLSPDYLHLFIEAFKLAIAERDAHVADPQFYDAPVGALLAKEFAAAQYRRIDFQRAASYPLPSGLTPHRDTVYLCVVDKDRNAASYINSLYHGFGAKCVAGDTGIVLHNRGLGFVLEEGHPNCIAPRKRPRHTIIPAMVYRDGKPILAYGVMGAEYQAMGHAYVLTNWIDFGMDLQQAADAPRFLPLRGSVTVERGIPELTRARLRELGHTVVEAELPWGGAQAIYIDPDSGVLHGASDPRKDGCALGY
jgi:gamma-glutamyltranspeptidase / glutathione hydrolase